MNNLLFLKHKDKINHHPHHHFNNNNIIINYIKFIYIIFIESSYSRKNKVRKMFDDW